MPKTASAPRASLDRLATMQDAVVTRHQLREHGYDFGASEGSDRCAALAGARP